MGATREKIKETHMRIYQDYQEMMSMTDIFKTKTEVVRRLMAKYDIVTEATIYRILKKQQQLQTA
jgi:hypothetical protein